MAQNRTRLGPFPVSGFQTRRLLVFGVRSLRAVSGFQTRLLCKGLLEPQYVAGGQLPVRLGVGSLNAADQTGLFQTLQVDVQLRAADLGIIGQLLLRGEAPEIGVMAVAQVPQNQFRGRGQPALQNRPIGGGMAHERAPRTAARAASRASGRSVSGAAAEASCAAVTSR